MSSPERARVDAELRPLAASHEARRRRWRWRLRAIGWGLPALFCLVLLAELDAELMAAGLVIALIAGGGAEGALRIVYRLCARGAAREFNRAFAMGTRRDDAVALLRGRTEQEKDPGRAAERLLAALYLPVEEPPAEAEPSPAEKPTLDLSPPSPAAGKGTSEKRRERSRRTPAYAPIPIEVAPDTNPAQTFRESAPVPLPLQPEAVQGGEDE